MTSNNDLKARATATDPCEESATREEGPSSHDHIPSARTRDSPAILQDQSEENASLAASGEPVNTISNQGLGNVALEVPHHASQPQAHEDNPQNAAESTIPTAGSLSAVVQENIAFFGEGSTHLTGPIADTLTSSSSETDSAVGDFVSTRSQSLSESAYEFRNENGRRYHAYRNGFEYNLPNDEQELDRLDLQHHLFYLTLQGELHRCALDTLPFGVQNVLDIGTGTGIWAIDYADKNGAAKVVGTDISPVQPVYVPPNCHFYVDDATVEWGFDEPFDFIHGRMLVVGIKNWVSLFEQCFHNLTPGGWVEFQDLCFPFRCDDGSVGSESPALQWSYHMIEGAANLNINLCITEKFPTMLAKAGFVDIRAERYAWPINRWPKDLHEKNKGVWVLQNVQEGLQGFSMGMFTRGLGWTPEQVEVFLADVRKAFNDRKSHVYIPIWVVYARKPLNESSIE